MVANPQKEDGFTAIANELYDALISFRIPGEARQVLDAIIRKTYGYNKKKDYISNSQIMEMTGLSKGNVSRALSKLITTRLVIKSDNKIKVGKLLELNKDYSSWIPFVIKSDNHKKKKGKLSKKRTRVIKSDNKSLSEVGDTKDNIHSKDNMRASTHGPVKKKDTDTQTLEEYVKLMKASPQRHIQIIGDYADTIKPQLETVGQWRIFTTKSLRVATALSKFTDQQIELAYSHMEKNFRTDKNPRGFITEWTLDTLLRYILKK